MKEIQYITDPNTGLSFAYETDNRVPGGKLSIKTTLLNPLDFKMIDGKPTFAFGPARFPTELVKSL